MKKLLALPVFILLASCSSSNDGCDCTQTRWERTAEYQGTSNTLVATTYWNAIGNAVAYNSDDCAKDGTLGEEGVISTEVMPNGNTKKEEFQYRITCQ